MVVVGPLWHNKLYLGLFLWWFHSFWVFECWEQGCSPSVWWNVLMTFALPFDLWWVSKFVWGYFIGRLKRSCYLSLNLPKFSIEAILAYLIACFVSTCLIVYGVVKLVHVFMFLTLIFHMNAIISIWILFLTHFVIYGTLKKEHYR